MRRCCPGPCNLNVKSTSTTVSTILKSIIMEEAVQTIVPIAAPVRSFGSYETAAIGRISAVAVFPDGRRIVTSSYNQPTLCLWDLTDGVLLKKMEGHRTGVRAMIVSRDMNVIASVDVHSKLIIWHGDTGEHLASTVVHSDGIRSLDFSPDGNELVTGSKDKMVKLLNTTSWQMYGNPIRCGGTIYCVRYSPSGGELLAIATDRDLEIWDPRNSKYIVKVEAIISFSLVWTPDSTHLLSGGSTQDPTIREWDILTLQQVGEPWIGHTRYISGLAINSTGTLIASASDDNHVRLWRRADQRTVAIFVYPHPVFCVTFSVDDKYIFGGGSDDKISEWAVPEDALLGDKDLPDPENSLLEYSLEERETTQVLPINSTASDEYNIRRIHQAIEELSIRDISIHMGNHNLHASRSLLMAQRGNWSNALDSARRSISIQPSLGGYLSRGIALCGNKRFWDAMRAFDLAFMFIDGNLQTIHLLFLIKVIALFNANQHKEAMSRIQELEIACPNVGTFTRRVVEAYLRVQLGISAFKDARHNEAADYFTAAINSNALSSDQPTHLKCKIFVVLFGWDLQASWQIANQNRCHALLRAGRLIEAQEAYRLMMDMSDKVTVVNCRDWSIAFEQECRPLCIREGDAALSANYYDKAIELYSAAIDLDPASDTIFASRCTAKLEKGLWEDALTDPQKVIELSPSSFLGYQLKHACMHGAQRYDEAITAFDIMVSKLDHSSDTHSQKVPHQYLTSAEAINNIQEVIRARLDNIPYRLLNTITGRLCDRTALENTFKLNIKYKHLLSSTMKYADRRTERIEEAVEIYFCSAMLSHRWEESEPLLRHIRDKNIYKLDPVGSIIKLQSFCKTARDAGYHWAWVDTCCIDQANTTELQHSVNSMFDWYRLSALTIVYLSDVPPSSKSGALARSIWNKRGWTVQEFLAPKIVRFYQSDWTPYLNDQSSNHKDSSVIMQELGDATGIDPLSLISFRPRMQGAREKLRWASKRVTTRQEDIAYSLFGIFSIHLPVIYGERKQNALGRLLQEIVAQSGDISCLDWFGKPSEFNSCLPAEITSYGAPPSMLSSLLPENEMQTSVSSLRDMVDAARASKIYQTLASLSAPLFVSRRLRLPCIVFAVTEMRRRGDEDPQAHSTFLIKANGLRDMSITTEEKLVQFSRARPTRQAFFLVRPWDRSLLKVSDLADARELSNANGVEALSPPLPPPHDTPVGRKVLVESETYSRALRLIVRLGEPFSAFLLAQQWGGEYKRIASDRNIVAEIKDMTCIHDMDIKTLEIL